MWSKWKKSFLEIVDKHAPLRKARVRGSSSPWITSELKKQMHEIDILKIKAIISNDPVDDDGGLLKIFKNSTLVVKYM